MIISIHQPDYVSYLGYFYKMSRSDRFVYLDDCQFSNDNMHHWNRVKTPQGECRLKIPVDYKFGDPITSVRTRDELGWKDKHLKTLQMNYSKSRFYNTIFPDFSDFVTSQYDSLADMNIAINTWIARSFGFQVEFFRSSELNIDSVREERVIDICELLEGNSYISGNGAKAYQVDDHFLERGINLIYSDYHAIQYPQQWMKIGFLENMSVLDYIFNCGFDWNFVVKAVKEINT